MKRKKINTNNIARLFERRKNLTKDAIKRDFWKQVSMADVIVTDQEKYSIALIYDRKLHDAPILTAKGIDNISKLILRIAKKRKIWISVDNENSRTLYEEIEINSPISEKFYKPISKILMEVEKRPNA